MKKTINIQNEANIKAKGTHGYKNHKPVICLETGDVYVSLIDAAEHIGCRPGSISNHLRGKQRSVDGKHFCYLSRVTESLDSIVTRLRETAAMEDDAKKWREYQAEQEAIRKEEEKRRMEEEKRAEEARKAREELLAKIAKATEKVARRTAVRANKYEEARLADERLMEAGRELEALQDMLG